MKRIASPFTDKRIKKIKIVDDFLPQSKDLILKEETTKTIVILPKTRVEL
jgi:hypothetical protein